MFVPDGRVVIVDVLWIYHENILFLCYKFGEGYNAVQSVIIRLGKYVSLADSNRNQLLIMF
jgi:hypothetical protein